MQLVRSAASGAAGPMFRRLSARRSFESVMEQIREQIALGKLREGDRLPAERELALQFGVSRNTVREALRALENARLLTLRQGVAGGAFVCNPGGEVITESIGDLYRLGNLTPEQLTEARLILGTEVARLACLRRDDDDLAALEENVRAANAMFGTGDLRAKVDLNLEFHSLLARAARNPVLTIVTTALSGVTRQFVDVLGPMPNRFVLLSHGRLLEHLRARNADAAAAEMRAYLKRVYSRYLGKASGAARAVEARPRGRAAAGPSAE